MKNAVSVYPLVMYYKVNTTFLENAYIPKVKPETTFSGSSSEFASR